MVYQKENFIDYSFINSVRRFNADAYCNGFEQIELHLHVDIDAEYSKDKCQSLSIQLKELRATPEKIGKKENTVRQFSTYLARYQNQFCA